MIATSLVVSLLGSTPAGALGGAGTDTRGGAQGNEVSASAKQSRIKVTQTSGPAGDKQGTLSSTDLNWEPPPCWYELVFTPEQLKNFSENDGSGDVALRQGWAARSSGPTTSGTRRTLPTTSARPAR
jgi:hypothetical protein